MVPADTITARLGTRGIDAADLRGLGKPSSRLGGTLDASAPGSFAARRTRPKGVAMARYGKKASEKVEKAMHERKKGTLKSGRSGKKVKSRKQAIAIGLSEARRAGGKVPPPKKTSSKRE
jgi:hypothetical protein